MAVSDEALMRQAACGNLKAFGELFDRHQPGLYAFLCRFLGDATTAEDVTQEVFWRVWQYRHSFDDTRRFATWLYGIARNTALTEFRRPDRGAVSLADLGERPGTEATASGFTDELVRELSLREQVREALAALPADQRLCLVLREYEERPYREIAEIVGCTEENARVLAHRARRALRELLRPSLEGEGSCV